jgi:hypothetical protein
MKGREQRANHPNLPHRVSIAGSGVVEWQPLLRRDDCVRVRTVRLRGRISQGSTTLGKELNKGSLTISTIAISSGCENSEDSEYCEENKRDESEEDVGGWLVVFPVFWC